MTENESEGPRGDAGDQLEGSSPSRGVGYESRGSEQSWMKWGAGNKAWKWRDTAEPGKICTYTDAHLHKYVVGYYLRRLLVLVRTIWMR